MDFNDIKNTWKNSFEEEKLLNKNEIEARLKIKSRSGTALRKIKRNYKFELIFSSILSVIFIAWLFFNVTSPNKYMVIISAALFFGSLTFLCWSNYNKVKNTIITSDRLKPALLKTIKDVEWYVKFNKSNFTKFMLIPFALVFGLFLGFHVGLNTEDIRATIPYVDTKEVIKILSVVVIGSLIMIPLSQYFNKKMYKQHLDELKQCLKEFEEIEEANNND